ncbi:VWA domain-containing protein [Candidatus Woesearchaeota archaeon]|nr:VWA domain-containing protein [Candidatus Woesearchaeota archaeon]
MTGFENPSVLLFLLLVPLIYIGYRMAMAKKKKAAMKFSRVGLIKQAAAKQKNWRVHALFWLSVLAIALLIIGFANPHIPLEQAKEGVNVVLVIDNSGSMTAQDYKPNRLEAAKASARILLESLDEKDHAGIVLFENGATTAAYLSPYKERVIEKLDAVRQREGKTALGDGLSLAVDMASSIPNKKKVIILLSDGVANAGVVSPQEAAVFAKTSKIQVYTVGMGSEDKDVLGTDWFGNPQYAELDEQTLMEIASFTDGKYFKSVDQETLDEVYKNISEDIEREKEETNISRWFFLAALAVLLVELYLRYGGKRIIQ